MIYPEIVESAVGKHILLADDETAVIEILGDLLNEEGFKTTVASDGMSALNLAKKEQPDLILLDLVMPVMSGFEVLANLRQDAWGKSARVLVFTNLSIRGEHKQMLDDNYPIECVTKCNVEVFDLVNMVRFFSTCSYDFNDHIPNVYSSKNLQQIRSQMG